MFFLNPTFVGAPAMLSICPSTHGQPLGAVQGSILSEVKSRGELKLINGESTDVQATGEPLATVAAFRTKGELELRTYGQLSPASWPSTAFEFRQQLGQELMKLKLISAEEFTAARARPLFAPA